MSDSGNKTNKHTAVDQEPEIFGRSRSREEIRAENRAERIREREEMRQAHREAVKRRRAETTPRSRRDILVLVGVLVLIVGVCAVALGIQLAAGAREEKFERSESSAHFLDEEVQPELTDDGLSAVINEMYYTKGGYLCVRMTLGNGNDTPQHLTSLSVTLTNEDSEEKIAGGYTSKISKKYTVPANGYNEYTFYLSPEHVSVTDDPLTNVYYEINVSAQAAE